MTRIETDYTPGDKPIPIGEIVLYAPDDSPIAGRYKVTDWDNPQEHPMPPPGLSLEEVYPDGAAYALWPEGVPRKFGFRHLSVSWVRRTSLRRADSERREER